MANEMALVSVVVPTKNRLDSLERCVKSVRRQDYTKFEIIVVDDGSDIAVTTEKIGGTILRNEKSRGAAAARNIGLDRAQGRFVIFLDDDAELATSTELSRAVKIADRVENCGALAFRQLLANGKASYMQPSHADVLSTAPQFFSYCVLMRREALKAVGGFESRFGYYCEETELSLRLIDGGWSILYDPNLAVFHHEDLRGRDVKRIARLSLRNQSMLVLLRYPLWLVLPGMMRTWLLHVRRMYRGGAMDWLAMPAVALELCSQLGYAVQKRKSVSFKTLRYVRQTRKFPMPVPIHDRFRTGAK
jgi:GT2 family glycosyltransferase